MSDQSTGQNERNTLLTVRNVMRLLALFGIVFVFCPSFLVSCSGQTKEVGVMTVVSGISVYGETVVKPVPALLICLFIPIAVIVFLCLKKWSVTKMSIAVLISSALDVIVWILFHSAVKKYAEENLCTFETTGYYYLNLAILSLLAVLSLLSLLKKVQLDSSMISGFTGSSGGTQEAISQMSAAITQMSSTVTKLAGNVVDNAKTKGQKAEYIGYCSKCGNGIEIDCKFCVFCGAPVPESMIKEALAKKEEEIRRAAEEAARKEAEEKARNEAENKKVEEITSARESEPSEDPVGSSATPNYCQKCGAKLSSDSKFCESCGAKVE